METRFPAAGGRLGKGCGCQYRLLAVGRASSIPQNERVSLWKRRAFPGRRRAPRLSPPVSDSSCFALDQAVNGVHNRMKWFWAILAVLLVNTAYISAVHPATVFYMANVLLHLVLGLALSVLTILLLRKKPALLVLLGSSVLGLYLAVAGNTSDHR